jgi:hypothetical protein
MVQLQQGFMVGGMGQFARQQCRAAHVRFGSFATDPFCVSTEQCPIRSESDHHPSRDRLFTLLHTVGCRLRNSAGIDARLRTGIA